MADAVLRDVAREIVQQGLLENWRFYLILLGLLLLSTAGGVFVTKYFGKRAELYATRSDLK